MGYARRESHRVDTEYDRENARSRVLTIVGNLISVYPENVPGDDPDRFLTDSKLAYGIAWESVEKIYENNEVSIPEIREKIPQRDTAIAAGLRKIGVLMRSDGKMLSAWAANYIEEHGEKLGIAGSIEEAYDIAQMVRPDSFALEESRILGVPYIRSSLGIADNYGGYDTTLFQQRTVSEVTVTFSGGLATWSIQTGDKNVLKTLMDKQGRGEIFEFLERVSGEVSRTNKVFMENGGGYRLRELLETLGGLYEGTIDPLDCGYVIETRRGDIKP